MICPLLIRRRLNEPRCKMQNTSSSCALKHVIGDHLKGVRSGFLPAKAEPGKPPPVDDRGFQLLAVQYQSFHSMVPPPSAYSILRSIAKHDEHQDQHPFKSSTSRYVMNFLKKIWTIWLSTIAFATAKSPWTLREDASTKVLNCDLSFFGRRIVLSRRE